MSQENVQAMRRLYDAFNSGDLDTFEQGVGRGIQWNEADNSLYAGGNPYRSFAAVRDGGGERWVTRRSDDEDEERRPRPVRGRPSGERESNLTLSPC